MRRKFPPIGAGRKEDGTGKLDLFRLKAAGAIPAAQEPMLSELPEKPIFPFPSILSIADAPLAGPRAIDFRISSEGHCSSRSKRTEDDLWITCNSGRLSKNILITLSVRFARSRRLSVSSLPLKKPDSPNAISK